MSLRFAIQGLSAERFSSPHTTRCMTFAGTTAILILAFLPARPVFSGELCNNPIIQASLSYAPAIATKDDTATALAVKATEPRTFYLDERAGNSQVTVFSQSTLEDFTGVCNRVAGECRVNPKRLEDFSGSFSIGVEDIKTGIELRDSHMRGADWLDAANHPQVTIKVNKSENVKRTADNTATMDLIATCTIRGAHNDVRIPATLTYLDESPTTMKRVKGDLIRIRAEFGVKLSDFGIKGPTGADTIGLKVADDIQLKATVFGSTEKPPEALTADKGGTTSAPVKLEPPKRP